MANQRDILNRIKSITNTKKITSTMEMVSSAKMKKVQKRLHTSKPYEEKVNEIISNLVSTGITASHNPLFIKAANPSRALILQITGNRGLCGSFNTNIINNTLRQKEKLAADGMDAQIYTVGKKGTNFFNFIKEPIFKSEENLDDKLTFEYVTNLGNILTRFFETSEFHEVYVSYSKVYTSSSQKPDMIKLLPIAPDLEEQTDVLGGSTRDYIFDPYPDRIFSYILPLYIKVKLFSCFLETSFSEQFARMVAMKNASDASSDMIKSLTVSYNRARQAKITNEIAEIVGGAAALE